MKPGSNLFLTVFHALPKKVDELIMNMFKKRKAVHLWVILRKRLPLIDEVQHASVLIFIEKK